jgi:hypothetical protein
MHSEKTTQGEAPALSLTEEELASMTGAGHWNGTYDGYPFWEGTGRPGSKPSQ